jgi:hypothetical protein
MGKPIPVLDVANRYEDGGRGEGVKKLRRSQKHQNELVGNQVFAKTVFRTFQFFHTFGATLESQTRNAPSTASNWFRPRGTMDF